MWVEVGIGKGWCRLIEELDVQFFEQLVLDTMGIVYPQYWL
jgi:hypothetical protein